MNDNKYEAPEVSKLNTPAAQAKGVNDYVYMNTVAVGEAYVAAVIAGVFFQVAFQIDTTYPV